MALSEAEYHNIRSHIPTEGIIAAEQEYMTFLWQIVQKSADALYEDFHKAIDLKEFWINYAPRQRGNFPSGTAVPWGEVGEKSIIARIVRTIAETHSNFAYPGLPVGSDLRLATESVLIHFDVKLTGPNDNANEVVASPYQISGDGLNWDEGVKNSSFLVTGDRAKQTFFPQLPPFYVYKGRVLLCLTYFLKAVYVVHSLGDQPLQSLELACAPNGLLLFDGPQYAQHQGLLIPGKDDKKTKLENRRVRVRLDPLVALDSWRSAKLERMNETWKASVRLPPPPRPAKKQRTSNTERKREMPVRSASTSVQLSLIE